MSDDKLDVDTTLNNVAKELGITTSQMPKEMMNAIAFNCTSKEPRLNFLYYISEITKW